MTGNYRENRFAPVSLTGREGKPCLPPGALSACVGRGRRAGRIVFAQAVVERLQADAERLRRLFLYAAALLQRGERQDSLDFRDGAADAGIGDEAREAPQAVDDIVVVIAPPSLQPTMSTGPMPSASMNAVVSSAMM